MKFSQRAVAAVVLGGFFLVISCSRHESQPVYDGRPLKEWCKDFYDYQPAGVRSNAKQAICQIGTNSLPFLMGEMRTLGKVWKQMGATNFNSSDELTERLLNLRKAFGALGPIAKPAVPELICLLNSPTNGANGAAAYALTQIDSQVAVTALTQALTNEFMGARLSAANALYEVRSNADMAVPNLIQCLKDKSSGKESSSMLRSLSAAALGFIGKEPKKAMPALIEALREDEETGVRIYAAHSLAEFGTNAQWVVPILMETSTNDSNRNVRLAATNALRMLGVPFPQN
jgi:HEAT repeat protein